MANPKPRFANARLMVDGVGEPAELRVTRPEPGQVDVTVSSEEIGATFRLPASEWARLAGPEDADAAVGAVLDVLAPFYETDLPGLGPVRAPMIRVMHDGRPVCPDDEYLRALAEQIVTRIRTAS